MSVFGRTLTIKGELRSTEDLTIEGRVEGPVSCEDLAVVIAESADVSGTVLARDITVFGRAAGQLIATEVVDVRARAIVVGDIISARFILDPAAEFAGRVEPQHLEAALRVARFRQQQQRGDETPTGAAR